MHVEETLRCQSHLAFHLGWHRTSFATVYNRFPGLQALGYFPASVSHFILKWPGSQVYFVPLGFTWVIWGSNAGPHTYMTCALFLPTELSLQILLTTLKQRLHWLLATPTGLVLPFALAILTYLSSLAVPASLPVLHRTSL